MSELINTNDNRAVIRWKLLTGASALAMAMYVSGMAPARAEDAAHPQIWIELGGQLSRLQDSQEIYAPPFVALTPPDFSPPQKAERPPLYGLDETAALTFQPLGSDWIFSASIRYGRASSGKKVHHQTYPGPDIAYNQVKFTNNPVPTIITSLVTPSGARFTDAEVKQTENQTVLDFQAGKDVGLGLFGRNASSSLEVGVRFAQFTSKSQIDLKEDPDWHFSAHPHTFVFPPNPRKGKPGRTLILQYIDQVFHSYSGSLEADRNFHGVGPSVSWQASLPFAGNEQNGELAIDWGVNAAVLFGRQKVQLRHQTTTNYGYGYGPNYYSQKRVQISQRSTPHTRSRNVTVPNVGGSVGLSWKLQNFKMSLGYRADFFFNAIDGGIDTRKSEDRGFFGPYASISIGLGD